MLSYKNATTKTLGKLKDKRVFLCALIIFIPTFINIIVSSIILKDLNTALYKICEEMYNVLLNSYSENLSISTETYNIYFSQIIDNVILYINPILITLTIEICVYIIFSLFVYVVYYMILMITNKEVITVKQFFRNLASGIGLSLLYNVKVLLWSLLFIVPGIIKMYSYSLCFYIKAENPHLKAKKCIKKSKELMKGRCERLFIQSLIFGLISVILNIVFSNVLPLFTVLPVVGNFIYVLALNYFYCFIITLWIINVAIYYDEVKKDEQFLKENPDLKEKGITGRIIKNNPRIMFTYGPFANASSFMTEEERKVYDANPFSKDRENKKNDPFED